MDVTSLIIQLVSGAAGGDAAAGGLDAGSIIGSVAGGGVGGAAMSRIKPMRARGSSWNDR